MDINSLFSGAVNADLLKGPVSALKAGIGGAAGIVAGEIKKFTALEPEMKEKVFSAGESGLNLFNGLKRALGDIDSVKDVKDIPVKLKPDIEDFKSRITGAAEAVSAPIKMAADLKDAVPELEERFKAVARNTFTAVKSETVRAVSDFAPQIANFISASGEVLPSAVSGLKQLFASTGGPARNTVLSGNGGSGPVRETADFKEPSVPAGGFFSSLVSAAGIIPSVSARVVSKASGIVKETLSSAASEAGRIISGSAGAAAGAVSTVAGVLFGISGKVDKAGDKLLELNGGGGAPARIMAALNMGGGPINTAAGAVNGLISSAGNALKGVGGITGDFASGVSALAGDFIKTFNIKELYSGAAELGRSSFIRLKETAGDFVGSAFSSVGAVGSVAAGVWQGAGNTLRNIAADPVSATAGLAGLDESLTERVVDGLGAIFRGDLFSGVQALAKGPSSAGPEARAVPESMLGKYYGDNSLAAKSVVASNISFSPNITLNGGNLDKSHVTAALKEGYRDFGQMLRDEEYRRERLSYGG